MESMIPWIQEKKRDSRCCIICEASPLFCAVCGVGGPTGWQSVHSAWLAISRPLCKGNSYVSYVYVHVLMGVIFNLISVT